MTLGKLNPLVFALEEAEVASGSGPPLVVGRDAYAGIIENSKHVFFDYPVFLERKDGTMFFFVEIYPSRFSSARIAM